MQTPAEKHLVQQICNCLGVEEVGGTDLPHPILNIGAGQSLSIEGQISGRKCSYICDRIDVDDCSVTFQTVRHCWICPVEEMKPVKSEEYHLAFANYVLEHVADPHKAAREIYRVLSPAGIFVATLPNPSAPEFLISKHTPLWFHQMVSRSRGWEAHYAYGSIPELSDIFQREGFSTLDVKYWPFVEGYLWRFPIVRHLGRWYDRAISTLNIRRMMGAVCITFQKSP